MTLEKQAEFGWYKAEPTSAKEIADLLSIVDRSTADSKVDKVSDDLRFQAAYNGVLTLLNIALRASGYRVGGGQGHHQRVIDSMGYTLTTLKADDRQKWIRKVKHYSQKRAAATYDLAGGVSPQDLAQVTKDLTALRKEVEGWLKQHHPELLGEKKR
jgi:hypothetical protein